MQVLHLTDPAHWSPHAVYQATRLFVSNLNARMAQRFLALILLPHIRNDIEDNKRLHHALFQAVKKATYKPDAFFKVGFVLSNALVLAEMQDQSPASLQKSVSFKSSERPPISLASSGRAC